MKKIIIILAALVFSGGAQASGVSRASTYNPASVAITGGTITGLTGTTSWNGGNFTVTGASGTIAGFSSNFTGNYKLNSKLLVSSTAPTIASGFGTSPSIASSNGTATFRLNVGTGGTASDGVITMPAASTGWNCTIVNISSPRRSSTTEFYLYSSTTTTVTIQVYAASTGALLPWGASDILMFNCMAY